MFNYYYITLLIPCQAILKNNIRTKSEPSKAMDFRILFPVKQLKKPIIKSKNGYY